VLHVRDDEREQQPDPSAKEFTLRAKNPINTPAMSPLIIEPTMIPISWARTAGVNQAVVPSTAPKTPPRINPSKILFIECLPRLLLRRPLSAAFVNLLSARPNSFNA